VVGLGTWLSHVVVERTGNRFAARPVDEVLPPLKIGRPTLGEQR
jgi:hypothetical protein